ncbi:Hypothetical protein GLP15_4140 [Giardia lamblia P15]|uniref:Uncharacterized protein n=1 Tax=Giardia intestinalis (strain P15) TaxID=658858 RepID=E1F0H7_GIAIA|nr:Hypothetical protein GLP15_4140 [Giardia lamblia P15]
MDSEHATRRCLSKCLGTNIHVSPIATLLFSSSSLVNSLIAGLFTEWDGKDPALLNEATMKLLSTLTTNHEPLFSLTPKGELGLLLCKAALLMVKERDFYIAYALVSAIWRSLQGTHEQKSPRTSACKGRLAYYRTLEAFLSAFCYLELDEYTIVPYSLGQLAQRQCLLASIHFLEYLTDGPIQLNELLQLLHVQLYLAVMFGHLDMLHECYIVTLYLYSLVLDLLLQLDLITISDTTQSNRNCKNCTNAKLKYLYLQIIEDRKVFDEETTITITTLLSDIDEAVQGHSQDKNECSQGEILLIQTRGDFVRKARELLASYKPSHIAEIISTLDQSLKNKRPYNIFGTSGISISQLYAGIALLRNLVESSFGMSTRLANATLRNELCDKMCEQISDLTSFFLQVPEEMPLHIGTVCSLRPYQSPDQRIDRPKPESIRPYLAMLNRCSKGLSKELQVPPLLNVSMIKSLCAVMCSCLMLLLVPTNTESTSIQLESVIDSLSMLSTHCTNELLVIYTSLEILNAFVASNCSILLLHDISESVGTPDDFQLSTYKDVVKLSIKRISSNPNSQYDAYLNKICDQVPKKSFCDDIDGWIEAIVDIMYTISRQSISLTAELVSMLQRLCRRESLTILRLLCSNDDRRLQIIKYLRYLWLLAQSYRDKVLCMHQRLQGYSYAAHTLPLISNSLLQRSRNFFPFQSVLLDLYVISLEW